MLDVGKYRCLNKARHKRRQENKNTHSGLSSHSFFVFRFVLRDSGGKSRFGQMQTTPVHILIFKAILCRMTKDEILIRTHLDVLAERVSL